MQSIFIIGILGGCGASIRTAQYFEEIINYYQKTFPRIRILLPLFSKGERSVASYLLGYKGHNPNLEIGVTLTARQWKNYTSGNTTNRIAECNQLIAAADCYEIVGDNATQLSPSTLFRLFIERCDYIIFNEHHAGWAETEIFDTQVVDMAVPIPVQYTLGMPKYTEFTYPLDRREYLDTDSGYYIPMVEFTQSTTYILRNGFCIQADHLPQIFLRKWLTPPPEDCYNYLKTFDKAATLFHQEDTTHENYLSLKVFVYAYTQRSPTQEMPWGGEVIVCFRQFRALLEIIASKRETGEPVETFDLLDFESYDKVMGSLLKEVCNQTSK